MAEVDAEPTGDPRNGITQPLSRQGRDKLARQFTDVANKHYAMTMQASFDRGVVDGAKIVGVTTAPPDAPKLTTNDDGEVVAENAPQKTPLNPLPTVQAKGRNPETQKKPMREKPANNWACLASALGDLVTKLPETTLIRTPLGCPHEALSCETPRIPTFLSVRIPFGASVAIS